MEGEEMDLRRFDGLDPGTESIPPASNPDLDPSAFVEQCRGGIARWYDGPSDVTCQRQKPSN
jgi:hypothetical protein